MFLFYHNNQYPPVWFELQDMGHLTVHIELGLTSALFHACLYHIGGLVQETRNATANTLGLRISCTNPSMCVCYLYLSHYTLRWRHNDHAGVSNHQPHGCLLNRLFRRKSKETSKLRVTGLCAGNSPGTGEFPAQMASYTENVSIWWRHHELFQCWQKYLPRTIQ